MDSRERERAEGWGWISASASILIAWGLLYGTGHDANAAMVLGSMGMGIWKVSKR